MKNKIKDKKGEVSILIVSLIFIVCIMLSAIIDMAVKQWGIKETQSKLDIAGTNALYNSIDLESLKLEELNIGGSSISMDGTSSSLDSSLYTSVVKDNYTKELSKVTYGGKKPTIRYVNVDFLYTNKGLGYSGSSVKERPQVSLQSVVSYTVSSSTVTDTSGIFNVKTGTSSLSNSTFNIKVEDSSNDGESILVIQSETKIVLK